MIQKYLWPKEMRKFYEDEVQRNPQNDSISKNINKRIFSILRSGVSMVFLLSITAYLVPTFQPFWGHFFLGSCLIYLVDSFYRINSLFTNIVVPINRGKMILGKIEYLEKRVPRFGGKLWFGWFVGFSFNYKGENFFIKKRFDFKEDVASSNKKGDNITIYVMENIPQIAIPAFQEIIKDFKFKT